MKKKVTTSHGLGGFPTFSVKDKNGNEKLLWNDNFLGRKLLFFFRKKCGTPYKQDGSLKGGLLPKLALYGIRIPFVTGLYRRELLLKNLITNDGLAGIASRINGAGSEAAFTYLALGTGTTEASSSDSSLEAEITDSGLERASATATRETDTETNDTARLEYTWTASDTKAVTECGAFNDSSGGVLLGHEVFSAVNLVEGDAFQIQYDFINLTN